MKAAPLSDRAGEIFQQESLNPSLIRALRGTVAFVVPLILAQCFDLSAEAVFSAMGAQVVALTDVRGAYRFRFIILVCVTLTITVATVLGAASAGHLGLAVGAMAILALLAGVARHLSGDYGPGLGIVAALLFVMALALPSGNQPLWHHALFTLAGGLWGIALQALLWPFRPQQPLRHATAESWIAVSELFAALRTDPALDEAARHAKIDQCERELRATLDRTAQTLATARTRRSSALITHLEEIQSAAGRLGSRASSLATTLEHLTAQPAFARIAPAMDSLLLTLINVTRSTALTTVTHRRVHFTATEVRLNRCAHLIQSLLEQLNSLPSVETGQLKETLRQMKDGLAGFKTTLLDTVDRGASPNGFPLRLPELSTLAPRSLLGWMTPPARIDPLLVRHTLRMAVMAMAAIALYEGFGIPRGYWIAFTLIVVLQPDYGSTRQKAAQRILGTLAGSVVASAFLWVKLPLPLLYAAIAVTVFGFAYYQKQRYGLAVFFVTLMLVLLTETAGTVHLDFTISRLLCNLAGGLLALGASALFWPSWERRRFPTALADALRANAGYLHEVAAGFAAGRAFDSVVLHAKRKAETANSLAAASLQRLAAEPARDQRNVDRASALLHDNTRLSRALTALTLHLKAGERVESAPLATTMERTGAVLQLLADVVMANDGSANGSAATGTTEVCRQIEALQAGLPSQDEPRLQLIHTQLAKIATELRAMTLALDAG